METCTSQLDLVHEQKGNPRVPNQAGAKQFTCRDSKEFISHRIAFNFG